MCGIELDDVEIPDVLLSVGAGFHADDLCVDGSDELWIEVGVAEFSG